MTVEALPFGAAPRVASAARGRTHDFDVADDGSRRRDKSVGREPHFRVRALECHHGAVLQGDFRRLGQAGERTAGCCHGR